MSSELAIRARGLGKSFALFDKPRDRLLQMFLRGRRKLYKEFWALRDIDIDIHRGETVGIVGCNGSGKSTLLQLIAGILTPTTGDLQVHGRVSALLELGAGFNPEYSGRENVYLSGWMHGIKPEEISERFDAIADFANIGDFMDMPVKTYSSGMYARLAFSVAVHVVPDILVVDEILSVGDERFQRKCFARIDHMKAAGATILFVSHSATSVLELCDRAVLLDRGQRLMFDLPKPVIDRYHKLLYSTPEEYEALRTSSLASDGVATAPESPSGAGSPLLDSPRQDAPTPPEFFDAGLVAESTVEYPSRGCRISDATITDLDGNRVNVLTRGREYCFRYKVQFTEALQNIRFGMMLKSVNGIELSGVRSHPDGAGLEYVGQGKTLDVSFRFNNAFRPGTYFVNAGVTSVVDGQETFAHRCVDIAVFRVPIDLDSHLYGFVDITSAGHCSIKEIVTSSTDIRRSSQTPKVVETASSRTSPTIGAPTR